MRFGWLAAAAVTMVMSAPAMAQTRRIDFQAQTPIVGGFTVDLAPGGIGDFIPASALTTCAVTSATCVGAIVSSDNVQFVANDSFGTTTYVFQFGNGYLSTPGAYASTGPNIGQISFSFVDAPGFGAVPEASTWALMILGFGAVVGGMRLRGVPRPTYVQAAWPGVTSVTAPSAMV